LATVTVEIESQKSQNARADSNGRKATKQTPNKMNAPILNPAKLSTVKEDTMTESLGNTGTCQKF
jgi:hypothetical protein